MVLALTNTFPMYIYTTHVPEACLHYIQLSDIKGAIFVDDGREVLDLRCLGVMRDASDKTEYIKALQTVQAYVGGPKEGEPLCACPQGFSGDNNISWGKHLYFYLLYAHVYRELTEATVSSQKASMSSR